LNLSCSIPEKHSENGEWSQSRTSKMCGQRGLQPVTTEVGTRVGITECAGQSDIRERVGAAESSVAEPAGTVMSQRVVVRRVVLQDISIDRRREAVQRLRMQTLTAGKRINPTLRVVNIRE